MLVCSTCARPKAEPHRRIVGGQTVEGCVDAFHGEPDAWAARPEARALRASQSWSAEGVPARA